MPVVKVAAAAHEDLKGIWAYVAEHSTEATANKLIRELTRRFTILRDHPRMGETKASYWLI